MTPDWILVSCDPWWGTIVSKRKLVFSVILAFPTDNKERCLIDLLTLKPCLIMARPPDIAGRDRGGAAKAMPFLDTHGVTGVSLGFDPKARLSREMRVRGLPTTFLLPAGQDAAWRFVGPFEWDDRDMLDLVRRLLAE